MTAWVGKGRSERALILIVNDIPGAVGYVHDLTSRLVMNTAGAHCTPMPAVGIWTRQPPYLNHTEEWVRLHHRVDRPDDGVAGAALLPHKGLVLCLHKHHHAYVESQNL